MTTATPGTMPSKKWIYILSSILDLFESAQYENWYENLFKLK